jgi:hypothetical protein
MALKYIIVIYSYDKPNPQNPSYKPKVRLRWSINLYADGDDREGDWDTNDHYLRSTKGTWKFVGGPDPEDGQLEFSAEESSDLRYPSESSSLYMVLDGWTYMFGDAFVTLGGDGRITARGGERAWPGPIKWGVSWVRKD